MEKKEFYSVPEIAKLMHISRVAVFKKVKKGLVRAKKAGKNYIISANEAFMLSEEAGTDSNWNKGDIVLYEQAGGPVVEAHFINDSIWMTQRQIALLFGTRRPAITKHIKNIFVSGELEEKSVSSILELTAPDGKKYKTGTYSLDMIISVGYRVNSKKATQFRVWATKVLRAHIEKGYTVNERRLKEKNAALRELNAAVRMISKAAGAGGGMGMEKELLNLIAEYSASLEILQDYDDMNLKSAGGSKPVYTISFEDSLEVVTKAKAEYSKNKKASVLFGAGATGKLKGIIGAVNQTFDGNELYPATEEKAAHLLYFAVKGHPFIDGNKRLAAILFIHYMSKNGLLYKKNGEKRVSDGALAALTLLAAVSNPREKETMINVITNVIK